MSIMFNSLLSPFKILGRYNGAWSHSGYIGADFEATAPKNNDKRDVVFGLWIGKKMRSCTPSGMLNTEFYLQLFIFFKIAYEISFRKIKDSYRSTLDTGE